MTILELYDEYPTPSSLEMIIIDQIYSERHIIRVGNMALTKLRNFSDEWLKI